MDLSLNTGRLRVLSVFGTITCVQSKIGSIEIRQSQSNQHFHALDITSLSV